MLESIGTPWLWGTFAAITLAVLALDLFVLGGNRAGRMSLRSAAGWSVVWIALASAFGAGLWVYLDASAGRAIANARTLEFFTGYLMEKALAVDNVFVWIMLFAHFAVPAEYQRRVLLWGVLCAIVLRAIMIGAGAWLIGQFSWVLYLFGAFLIYTGIKMALAHDAAPDLENQPLLVWLRKHLRMTPELHGERFFVRRDGLLYATPLLLVLALVEFSDVVFAVDSIPAIFAITLDPFIVLTSNVFAIMGLRAMYFLLAGVHERFHLLKYGLAIVLAFVGAKMLLVEWLHVPVALSLGFVAVALAGAAVASVLIPPPGPKAARQG
ncbi:MAG: TerC family protein [Rhodocyclaceae bacterium]|nr:TerC family protein [Rhodocyclaceae bacterium]MBX3667259.1 TerC family protein [Rhodocyclaceae bacterium]